jgi:transcriptional regulator with XRE-family HTH domain
MALKTRKTKGHPDAPRLRKEAGEYLKKVREKAEVTQMALSKELGWDYYTLVSAIETGKATVPPDLMAKWAKAVNVDIYDFAKTLLRYYEPYFFQALFMGRK